MAGSMWEGIGNSASGGAYNNIWGVLSAYRDQIFAPKFNQVVSMAGSMWEGIGNSASGTAYNQILSVMNAYKNDIFGKKFSEITSLAADAWTACSNAFNDIRLQGLVTKAQTAWNSIAGIFSQTLTISYNLASSAANENSGSGSGGIGSGGTGSSIINFVLDWLKGKSGTDDLYSPTDLASTYWKFLDAEGGYNKDSLSELYAGFKDWSKGQADSGYMSTLFTPLQTFFNTFINKWNLAGEGDDLKYLYYYLIARKGFVVDEYGTPMPQGIAIYNKVPYTTFAFHSGGVIPGEGMFLGLRGEGVLNRSAMGYLGEQGFNRLNSGQGIGSTNQFIIYAWDGADVERAITDKIIPALRDKSEAGVEIIHERGIRSAS